MPTITLRDRCEKPVTCEQCGHAYTYTLECQHQVVNHQGWKTQAEYAHAVADANVALRDKLRNESAIAPCLECGWVQQAMIRDAKAKSYPNLKIGVVTALLLGPGGGAALALLSLWGHMQNRDLLLVFGLVGIVVGAVAGGAFFAARRLLIGRIDPNRNFVRKERAQPHEAVVAEG